MEAQNYHVSVLICLLAKISGSPISTLKTKTAKEQTASQDKRAHPIVEVNSTFEQLWRSDIPKSRQVLAVPAFPVDLAERAEVEAPHRICSVPQVVHQKSVQRP